MIPLSAVTDIPRKGLWAALFLTAALALGCSGPSSPEDAAEAFFAEVFPHESMTMQEAVDLARENRGGLFTADSRAGDYAVVSMAGLEAMPPSSVITLADLSFETLDREGDDALVRVTGSLSAANERENLSLASDVDETLSMRMEDGRWKVRFLYCSKPLQGQEGPEQAVDPVEQVKRFLSSAAKLGETGFSNYTFEEDVIAAYAVNEFDRRTTLSVALRVLFSTARHDVAQSTVADPEVSLEAREGDYAVAAVSGRVVHVLTDGSMEERPFIGRVALYREYLQWRVDALEYSFTSPEPEQEPEEGS